MKCPPALYHVFFIFEAVALPKVEVVLPRNMYETPQVLYHKQDKAALHLSEFTLPRISLNGPHDLHHIRKAVEEEPPLQSCFTWEKYKNPPVLYHMLKMLEKAAPPFLSVTSIKDHLVLCIYA